MISLTIKTETIRLSQFLKLANVVLDGVEAKLRIQDGLVMVNATVEMRRGRKLKHGDQVAYAGAVYEVCGPDG
jgi:ribosome-associated protein